MELLVLNTPNDPHTETLQFEHGTDIELDGDLEAEPVTKLDRRPANDSVPIIDMETYDQLLEIEEDDDNFSQLIVQEYFERAETVLADMDAAAEAKTPLLLSGLAYFLKGSSATVGLTRIQRGYKMLQLYSYGKDGINGSKLTDEEALVLIRPLLVQLRKDNTEAQKWMKERLMQNDAERVVLK